MSYYTQWHECAGVPRPEYIYDEPEDFDLDGPPEEVFCPRALAEQPEF
jgi:hypothetical protein